MSRRPLFSVAIAVWLANAFGWAAAALAQEEVLTRELTGRIGSRAAVLLLTTNRQKDGTARVTGEYLVPETLQRRFLEGESSAKLGVTTLREGPTPILFGRAPTGTFEGTWRDGIFRGTRYGATGRPSERFEFSERFPSLEALSSTVHCDAGDAAYSSSLEFAVDSGKLRPGSLHWKSRLSPSGQSCSLGQEMRFEQAAFAGGLRFVAAEPSAAKRERCAITLREVGDYLRISAEGCDAQCGSQAYLEPVLIDRRGGCQLLRPVSR